MRLACLMFGILSAPFWASAATDVACFYDRDDSVSGSFILRPGKIQVHIDVVQIGEGVDDEVLDGHGFEETSGFDAIGWTNSYLAQNRVAKGYITVVERPQDPSNAVILAVADIDDSKILNLETVNWPLDSGELSKSLGFLECKIRKQN